MKLPLLSIGTRAAQAETIASGCASAGGVADVSVRKPDPIDLGNFPMVLTRQLFDAANQASAHVIFERTIWDKLSLNPVQLWFVWPSVAPVLRTAAGVRPKTLAVESQGHRQQKFNPVYVRLHWYRFGGKARLSRLPGA